MVSGTERTLNGIWGASSDVIFAVGLDGTVLFYDGSTWQGMGTGDNLSFTGVWGTSFWNVYAVTFEGEILHFDGTMWTTMFAADVRFASVSGTSDSDVFAVGRLGKTYRFNGR
jgi:hypothetical protein